MCWQLLHPDHFVLSFANTPFQDGPSAEARMKQAEAGDLRGPPAPSVRALRRESRAVCPLNDLSVIDLSQKDRGEQAVRGCVPEHSPSSGLS